MAHPVGLDVTFACISVLFVSPLDCSQDLTHAKHVLYHWTEPQFLHLLLLSFIILLLFGSFFETESWLYNSGWPHTHNVPSALTSQVLGYCCEQLPLVLYILKVAKEWFLFVQCVSYLQTSLGNWEKYRKDKRGNWKAPGRPGLRIWDQSHKCQFRGC